MEIILAWLASLVPHWWVAVVYAALVWWGIEAGYERTPWGRRRAAARQAEREGVQAKIRLSEEEEARLKAMPGYKPRRPVHYDPARYDDYRD